MVHKPSNREVDPSARVTQGRWPEVETLERSEVVSVKDDGVAERGEKGLWVVKLGRRWVESHVINRVKLGSQWVDSIV